MLNVTSPSYNGLSLVSQRERIILLLIEIMSMYTNVPPRTEGMRALAQMHFSAVSACGKGQIAFQAAPFMVMRNIAFDRLCDVYHPSTVRDGLWSSTPFKM